MFVATYCKLRLTINEDYLAGNAKNQNIDKKQNGVICHIRRALATVANRKCGPENCLIYSSVI